MPLLAVLYGLGALGAGLGLVFGLSRLRGLVPGLGAGGMIPTVPTPCSAAHAAAHVANRPLFVQAAALVLGRPATLGEVQYFQSIGGGIESFYGDGWKGSMIGSTNMFAVQCSSAEQGAATAPTNSDAVPNIGDEVPGGATSSNSATESSGIGAISKRLARLNALGGVGYHCVDYQDSNPDGSSYPIKFKYYDSAQDGINDGAKQVLGRSSVVKALESSSPSCFRASFAMRRTKYYGGFCPKATAQYGSADATASFGTPDKNAGTQACQAECVTAHAMSVANIIAQIATACGDAQMLSLGTYADAASWYKSTVG